MMLADKNEEGRFQKSPWNALCKNGLLFEIPLFQSQILGEFFNQEDSTEFQKKLSFSRKLKNTKFEPRT